MHMVAKNIVHQNAAVGQEPLDGLRILAGILATKIRREELGVAKVILPRDKINENIHRAGRHPEN